MHTDAWCTPHFLLINKIQKWLHHPVKLILHWSPVCGHSQRWRRPRLRCRWWPAACTVLYCTVLYCTVLYCTVADVPGVGAVPLLAATPHPRVPAEHRLPLPSDALPPAGAHRNGENVQYCAHWSHQISLSSPTIQSPPRSGPCSPPSHSPWRGTLPCCTPSPSTGNRNIVFIQKIDSNNTSKKHLLWKRQYVCLAAKFLKK